VGTTPGRQALGHPLQVHPHGRGDDVRFPVDSVF